MMSSDTPVLHPFLVAKFRMLHFATTTFRWSMIRNAALHLQWLFWQFCAPSGRWWTEMKWPKGGGRVFESIRNDPKWLDSRNTRNKEVNYDSVKEWWIDLEWKEGGRWASVSEGGECQLSGFKGVSALTRLARLLRAVALQQPNFRDSIVRLCSKQSVNIEGTSFYYLTNTNPRCSPLLF